MPLGKLLSVLRDIGKTSTAPTDAPTNPYARVWEPEPVDVAALAALSTRFEKARPVFSHLCFPVQIAHTGVNGRSYMEGVVIKHAREENQEVLFMTDSLLDGRERVFASTAITELHIGVPALYGRAGNEPLGKYRGGTLADTQPLSLAEFLEVFATFRDGRYESLRHKLHVLLFLTRCDGALVQDEQGHIERFIATQPDIEAAHSRAVLGYARHALVTPRAFETALEILDTLPEIETARLLSKAVEIIEVDAQVSGEEQGLLTVLRSALAG